MSTKSRVSFSQSLAKWIAPGIGIKRWLLLLLAGIFVAALGFAFFILNFLTAQNQQYQPVNWLIPVAAIAAGIIMMSVSLFGYAHWLLLPYRKNQPAGIIDTAYAYSKRQKGIKVVAIGGGTGLPSILRAMKPYTSNITAIVTVADDGGSSGRLRRDLGVLPPGDLRNNIAALADDESLMTQLFQHRFNRGDLGGHAFGNLFISALASVTGSLESALIETARVLNIQGQVFPATMDEVDLVARVYIGGKEVTIHGESAITGAKGRIEEIRLSPPNVEAFAGSVDAILNADIVVLGPGSLFTSILPNLLVPGISSALRATKALRVYVCNIATQPGETDHFSVADHVLALEQYLGRGMIEVILANNAYPKENAGKNTVYVMPIPQDHEILQRYDVWMDDLVDVERPWRHDPEKLAGVLLQNRPQVRQNSVNGSVQKEAGSLVKT